MGINAAAHVLPKPNLRRTTMALKKIDTNVLAFPVRKPEPRKVKLAQSTIMSHTLPAGMTDVIFWDDTLEGYGLRVRSSGKRTFLYAYAVTGSDGKRTQRKIGIGDLPEMKEPKARKIAGDHAADVRRTGDPAALKQENRDRAADTFAALRTKYLASRADDVADGTIGQDSYDEIERHLTKNLAGLDDKRFDLLEVRDISAELNKMNKSKVQRNRTLSSLVTFGNWCVSEGYFKTNAAAFIEKKAETSRDRTLEKDEIKAVWKATAKHGGGDTGKGGGDYRDIVRLLLLTGCRASEIGDLQKREIKLDERIIDLPGSRTKNGLPFVIPMSDAVYAICKRRVEQMGKDDKFVFGIGENAGYSGWSKAKTALDELADLGEHWVIHDLRRTFVTGMSSISVQPHVVEACVNHVTGVAKAGVAGVYNKYQYQPEKTEALALWAAHVAKIVG
jgi:integrase